MPDKSLDAFLGELAALAAEQTLPRFRNLASVENKKSEGFDPVTEADREAERVIREAIMARYPDHGIEGEEFGVHNEEAQYTWAIDPVDGTRAFVAGIPVWGTLIGFCENRRPIAGMMSQPFTGEKFTAVNGEAVFEHNGNRQNLETRKTLDLNEAILMTTAPELFGPAQAKPFKQLSAECRMTRYGADCYAYCMLAAGQIDLVVEAGLSFYDIAALIPIVEAAGGVITDWQGRPFGETGEVVAAATPELHTTALEKLSG